jgi:hypothetical protein
MNIIKGNHVLMLYIQNAFQNTIQCDASKLTCNMLPPFFAEYLHLHWPDHPGIDALVASPHLFALHNFQSMQGEKDAGRHWYKLLSDSFENISMHRSVEDYASLLGKICSREYVVLSPRMILFASWMTVPNLYA